MTTRAALALTLSNRRTIPRRLRLARDRVLREFEAIARPGKTERKRAMSEQFKQTGEK